MEPFWVQPQLLNLEIFIGPHCLPVRDIHIAICHILGTSIIIADILSNVHSLKISDEKLLMELNNDYHYKSVPSHFLNLQLHICL